MFGVAVGHWGIQPSEFWKMTLPEFFAILATKEDEADRFKEARGELTDETKDALLDMLEEAQRAERNGAS